MDFVNQPEDAKKFGSIKWLKWNLVKNPHIFVISSIVPFMLAKAIHVFVTLDRDINNGTYVPNVVMNRYAICRPDDWMAQNTPKRYISENHQKNF